MSQHSSEFLQDIFQVPAAKIDVIPHGVPNLAFVDPNFYKDRFGVGGQSVLLTFGLLSPNKGVETVIAGNAAHSGSQQQRDLHRRRRNPSSHQAA